MIPTAPLQNRASKILVVDDDISVHRLLTAYLKKHKFIVENCLDSQEAVEKVTRFQPDLVLLDLMMPGLDGISATRRIRNLDLSSYLPIIVLTARKDIRDMVLALEAGADDYITKPFEFEELMARLKNMLRLKTLQDRLLHKSAELNEANQQINRLNHTLMSTNKKLQKKLYEFHNLVEVSYRVMGQLEFEQLLRQAVINVLGIFATRNALLLLANEQDNDLFEVVESRGYRPGELDQLQVYRHDKLVHYVELIKHSFRVKELPREFKDIVPFLKGYEIDLVSPLIRNDNVVGLLCLGPSFKDEDYSDDSIEMLGILTNMLTIAVHNAQMYEHIRALSYTDGMTGLHNYRFFRLRIKEEYARSRRENVPVSLLILDVDNFKNYNDTLGHPAGDEVLRKVSFILKQSVRDNDIVARYGGEEFAIILPGADKDGASALAERIRVKVQDTEFYRQEIQPEGKLTISIGIATFPDDAINEVELIENADKALYHAKETGKNKVVEAQEVIKPI